METTINLFIILIKLPIIYLAADLFTGVVHWIEDVYGNPSSLFFGKLIFEPNVQHHRYPRKFTERTYWGRNNIPLFVFAMFLAVFWIANFWYWELVLMLIISSQANEVHCWAHRPPAENGTFITWLQKRRIIQSRIHHLTHHRSPFDVHYCILTDFVNPICDRIQLWIHLEKCVSYLGVKRYETSVK